MSNLPEYIDGLPAGALSGVLVAYVLARRAP
jgi:hypothetical protein